MRVLLYIKDADEQFIHVSTATDGQELYHLMQYARLKVINGYDVKIQNEQE